MRVINSFSVGATSNPGLVQLPRPCTFQDGKVCQRFRTEAQLTISSTDASPYNLTQADLLSLFQKLFTGITLWFGDQAQDLVDNGLSFNHYRLLNWILCQRDVIVGKFGTVNMVELADYPAGGQNLTVPANSTLVITIELPRSFMFEGFGAVHVDDWCPGSTQMKQMGFQFNSTAATWSADTAKQTVTGTINFNFIVDEADGRYDRWAAVPRVYLTNQSALEIKLTAGGVLLGVAEMTAAGYATTMVNPISIQAEGKPDVHTMIQPQRLVNEAVYLIPEGGLNPQTLATVLYMPDRAADISDLPIADTFTFHDAAQDLSPFQLFWVVAPRVDAAYAEGIVRPNTNHTGVNGKGAQLLATNEFRLSGKPYGRAYAAVSPIALVTPDMPAYNTAPGTYWQQGQPSQPAIPKTLKDATVAAVNAAGGTSPAAQAAVAAQASSIAASTPGASSASGKVTPTQLNIAGHISNGLAANLGAPAMTNLLKVTNTGRPN